MQVNYTDLGVEYSYWGQTVTFEGEQDCGDVFVNDTQLGEYERDSKGDCYVVFASTGKRVRVGQTEREWEHFVALVCKRAMLGLAL